MLIRGKYFPSQYLSIMLHRHCFRSAGLIRTFSLNYWARENNLIYLTVLHSESISKCCLSILLQKIIYMPTGSRMHLSSSISKILGVSCWRRQFFTSSSHLVWNNNPLCLNKSISILLHALIAFACLFRSVFAIFNGALHSHYLSY